MPNQFADSVDQLMGTVIILWQRICGKRSNLPNAEKPSGLTWYRYDHASLAILKQLSNLEALIIAQGQRSEPLNTSYTLSTTTHVQQSGNVSDRQKLHAELSPETVHFKGGQNTQHYQAQHSLSSQDGSSSALLILPTERVHERLFKATDKSNVTDALGITDVPPSSTTLKNASSEMSIEAILRWPLFEQRLSRSGIDTKIAVVEILGQSSCSAADTPSNRDLTYPENIMNIDGNIVENLIENFLVNNLLKNPILDPAILRRDGQEFVRNGLQWDGRSCLIVSRKLTYYAWIF